MTVLEALVARVRRMKDHNRTAVVAPDVILWPDPERQFEPLLARLRAAMPELYSLGDYAPEQRTGPAIWLRCVLGGSVPHAPFGKYVPVLYLPGIGKNGLKAIEQCPRLLQPLAELQFRGEWFQHPNAREWSVSGFLSSGKDGLGLDLAEDHGTLAAVRQVLVRLADVRVDELRGRKLDASVFLDLLSTDPDRDVLRWMNQPDAVKAEFQGAEWAGFCARTVKRYGVHPDQDGPLSAADRLIKPEGPWKAVWSRFEESAESYPNVTALLGKVSASMMHPATSPTVAAAKEDELRAALLKLGSATQPAAISMVTALDAEHAPRRAYVWARLGKTPLANAVEHLATLASSVGTGAGAGTPDQLAGRYADGGWRVDHAVVRALAATTKEKDADAVNAAVVAIYRPWLEEQAAALGASVVSHGYPRPSPLGAPGAAECILFADGMRMDVGRSLAEVLSREGIKNGSTTRWVAFPPVTPTAKPAASPIAHLLTHATLNEEFRPAIAATGKLLTQDLFKKLLTQVGVQFLDPDEVGDPAGSAWTEYGDIDHYGHEHGWKTARHVDGQVRELAQRVHDLFDGGWQRVRIVTDHGWLLLPGNLPKRDLHATLTETRWRRCATLKAGVKPSVQTVPWHWNKDVQIAVAPGIGIFLSGEDYSHGGLTVQECVVPVIVAEAPKVSASAVIDTVKWVGLLCKVTLKGSAAGLSADVRTKPGDPSSSLALEKKAKAFGATGTASVPVDDGSEDLSACVVVLDAAGHVLDKKPTMVGGGS